MSMIRLFVQDRNTATQQFIYPKKPKKEKTIDKRNVREVPKQTFVNMPLGKLD